MSQGDNKTLVNNRKARFNYTIEDTFEAGMVLVGSEVKSLRQSMAALVDAYAEIRQGEAWLVGATINEYPWANQNNHDPTRRRKLLLHKSEIKKIAIRTEQRGYSLIPLSIYLHHGKIKIKLGLGIGKRQFEKRDAKRQSEDARAIERALKHRRHS